jgi:hypothetical protein
MESVMRPSEELENYMRDGMSQDLCDEIDEAFRMTNYQSGQIDELRSEIAGYRILLDLTPTACPAANGG